ncbi:MAG: hypothetical protein ACOCTH_01255 [Halodesulfurarchaeum sp.]
MSTIVRYGKIALNLLFFPVFLAVELTYYTIRREWLAHSPDELWGEVLDSAE